MSGLLRNMNPEADLESVIHDARPTSLAKRKGNQMSDIEAFSQISETM